MKALTLILISNATRQNPQENLDWAVAVNGPAGTDEWLNLARNKVETDFSGQWSLQARIVSFKGSCVHILVAPRTDVTFNILPFILHYFWCLFVLIADAQTTALQLIQKDWQLIREEEMSSFITGFLTENGTHTRSCPISGAGDSEELLYFEGLHGPCRRLESESHDHLVGFIFLLVLFYTAITHLWRTQRSQEYSRE